MAAVTGLQQISGETGFSLIGGQNNARNRLGSFGWTKQHNLYMSRCTKCGGYNSGDRWECPECTRLEEQRDADFALARMQEEDQRQLLEEGHVKELTRKLLDLALESLQNKNLATEKVRLLMQSSTFCENEWRLWSEIAANSFLADCYYPFRLGNPPELNAIRNLPQHSRESIEAYLRKSERTPFITGLKSAWDRYQSEVIAENQRIAEAAAKQRAIDEVENKKQEEVRKARSEQERRRQAVKDMSISLVALFYTAVHLLFVLGLVQLLKETQGLDSTPVTGFWTLLICLIFLWIRPLYSSVKDRQRFGFPWFGFSESQGGLPGGLYEIVVTIVALYCTFKVVPPGGPRVAALVCLGMYTYVVPFRRAVSHGVGGSLAGTAAFFVAKFGTSLLIAGYAKIIALIWGADASPNRVTHRVQQPAEVLPHRAEPNQRLKQDSTVVFPQRKPEPREESRILSQNRDVRSDSIPRRGGADLSEESEGMGKLPPRSDTLAPVPENRSNKSRYKTEMGVTAEVEVIRDYYKAFDEHDSRVLLNCLADYVDYFDQGRIPKNKVLKDIEGDWKRYQSTANRVSEFTRNPDGSLSFLLEYRLMQGDVPRAGVLKMSVRFSDGPTPKMVFMKHQVIRAR